MFNEGAHINVHKPLPAWTTAHGKLSALYGTVHRACSSIYNNVLTASCVADRGTST